MKVALIGAGRHRIPPLKYGAVERHIWELSNALSSRGIEAAIVNHNFGSEYRFIPWAMKQLQAIEPDIIHAHTSAVGASLCAFSKPLVFTSHNPAWSATDLNMKHRWGLGLERRIARHCSAFIALTEAAATQVAPYTKNLHVIPGAIDHTQWETSSLDGGYALSVGKIDRRKGYHHAVADGLPYIIAGKSIGDSQYERELRDLGFTLYLDPSNTRLRSLYRRASVFVHPSSFDVFSIAVLEAMASGLPIVASPVCRDQVIQNVNGFLVDDGDYAMRIARILKDKGQCSAMGSASRRLVEDRFSWDVIADKIVKVYKGIA